MERVTGEEISEVPRCSLECGKGVLKNTCFSSTQTVTRAYQAPVRTKELALHSAMANTNAHVNWLLLVHYAQVRKLKTVTLF